MTCTFSILKEIKRIGPVLPGSLETVYTVCGKQGCRCADKQNPKKHGPYYRLSYSLAGRNSSMFVKQQDVEVVRTMIDNYKKLRALSLDLALATLDSVKKLGIAETLKLSAGDLESNSGAGACWKDKCRTKALQLKDAAVKIRDLINSRDKWRKECLELRKSKTKAATAKEHHVKCPEASNTGEKK